MTRGCSFNGGLTILQTRKSPSEVCVASISDFCLEEEACQLNVAMGEGPRDVLRVCKIVKVGWRAANKIEPLL